MGPEEIEREMKRESEEIVSKERVERGGGGGQSENEKVPESEKRETDRDAMTDKLHCAR